MSDEPSITPIKTISPVWLVPIVAALIALALAYKTWREHGPTIEISFSKAEGIEPKRTKIRYKDVVVGTVKAIRVSNDLNRVIATAELAPEFSQHLTDNTKFWIVAPRISINGISGLNTLLSGVYIEMDIGEKGSSQTRFEGLDEAPRVLSNAKGRSITLLSQTLGSLDRGSPVLYKQIRVGEVTGYRLNVENSLVEISIFIEAPFDQLVQSNSNFWNVSGVNVELTANGINAQVESLNSLLAGGIAFSNVGSSDDITSNTETFYLAPNYKSVTEADFASGYRYQLLFKEQSVRGLSIDAPVEYYGIRVGKVSKIRLLRDEDETPYIKVDINLYPSRFGFDNEISTTEFTHFLEGLFYKGFRAQLKSASLITGALIIDLVKTEEQDTIKLSGKVPQLPTTSSNVERITQQISALATKIDKIPVDSIGKNLNNSLKEFNTLLSELNDRQFAKSAGLSAANVEAASQKLDGLLTKAGQTLNKVDTLLGSMENSIAPDSELYYELLQAIKSIGESADSVRTFTDELNRHPQSLILGKEAR